MKLNWFSPLPPAKSGIADFTAHVLPALQEHGEVVLWTDQIEWDDRLEMHASVRSYRDHVPWDELNRADITIYHVGNNPSFHARLWQISCHHPGIIVLHDTHLQHLFAGIYLAQKQDYMEYCAHMDRYYGREGKEAAKKFWDGLLTTEFMAERYPLTLLALENAIGVVVHVREAFLNLQKQKDWPIAYLPLPYPASPYTAQTRTDIEVRRAMAPPFRIIIAGHIGANRRIDGLFRALAEFSERDKFHVDIYGELWNKDEVLAQVYGLKLSKMVRLHGFVPEAELNAALTAAHLSINLRYPTMGEASASQLRFWDYALPTLVTKVGWYAEIPEMIVGFVRPDHETADLQSHLKAFLADPVGFAEMGTRGRHLLETQHSPTAYAKSLMSFVSEVQSFRPCITEKYLVRRVGVEFDGWIKSLSVEQNARAIAEAIVALATGGNYFNTLRSSSSRGLSLPSR